MQAPADNSITVVDSHIEPYADNLNEKSLGTQYIYTTEGQLIPAGQDNNSSNMDLNSGHYNTTHVTEAQSIQIQQVDYQYEQQYPDGTVQQVMPVSGTEFAQDQTSTYTVEQSTYVPQTAEGNAAISAEQQEYASEVVTTQQSTTTYECSTTSEVDGTHPKPSVTENQANGESDGPENKQQILMEVEQKENVDQVAENVEVVPEFVEATAEISTPVEPSVEPVSDKESITKPIQDVTAVSQAPEKIQNVETIEEENVKQSVKEAAIELDEDQTNLEILKSNPAIEIQNDESSEDTEEQESSLTEEPKVEVKQQSAAAAKEPAVANEIQEEGVNEEINAQDTVALEEEEVTIVTDIAAETEISTPRPRGRKPKTDIPLHILGHDVNKPMENFVNGKTPKPRLGVKVPYRNLTSQIVSKDEIENEILERGRKKYEEKQELSFARQLTSRLAQKIAPSSDDKSKSKSTTAPKRKDVQGDKQIDKNANRENLKRKVKETIDNNSDLLAILEGDGDAGEMPELSRPIQSKESTPTDETNLKNLEREIALQQLQDLPYLSPKTRFIKGNSKFKVYSKEPSSTAEGNGTDTSSKSSSPVKTPTPKSPIKSHILNLEVEPQIKVNMALKTYSRKRKSSDGVVESTPPPSKKTSIIASPEEIDIKPNMQPPTLADPVYITKSSRIIKKKVIWDPDETPNRTKPSPVKADTHAQPKVFQKPIPPKNESRSADLPKKPAVDLKVKTDKKVEEKSSPKKTVPAEKKNSPGSVKIVMKHKKPRSEVDRLLGDEGAIKMLYDLKNSENAIEEKRKKTIISVERTFKELAKKADQIKSDLVNTSTAETPKSLRKKEPIISPSSVPKHPLLVPVSTPVVPGTISRQKSKDSARSTPPPSPAFSFPNEVSYLIRRRSSTSISSGGDTGGSLEYDESDEKLKKKRPISTATDPLKIKKNKKSSEPDKVSQKRAEHRIGQYKSFNLKKINTSVTIDLYTGINTGCYFTSELLNELTTALNKISKEKDCHVVLIKSSKNTVFTNGLKYKDLVSEKESIRKNKASELADRVRNFIKCLMDFPKILIAGIQGTCVGLGVTILPLFDIVIASDGAQFSTAYGNLGCVAEAGFLLTVPFVASHGLAGELLYASQNLTADEAFRRGLISKLCWPEKYQDTIRATLTAVAQGSKQSLESTKKQLRSNIKQISGEVLEAMTAELVEHWTSNECQNSFALID